MNRKSLHSAMVEAKRFLRCAERLEDTFPTPQDGNGMYGVPASKESSACRRASMDLTRVLAELRKP